jgi:hypothetical protein
MSNKNNKNQDDIIDEIIAQSRYRKIVPFIGSGISFSTGFPTIRPIINYLVKVNVVIEFGIYRKRFPPMKEGESSELVEHYRLHPSEFIRTYGWPDFGGINSDLWNWLDSISSDIEKLKENDQSVKKVAGHHVSKNLNDDFVKGLQNKYTKALDNGLIEDFFVLERRDHMKAVLQWFLRREQAQKDDGTEFSIKQEWLNWKRHRLEEDIRPDSEKPRLLYGDWESLLDKLCEGDFSLVDKLFSELEKGRSPAQAHRIMALLQPMLNIPLVLSITHNYSSFNS